MSRAASKGKGKTYVYNFNVVLGLNFVKNMLKDHEINEATHGEDGFYLFKTMMTPPVKVPSKDFDAVKRMVGIDSQFLDILYPGWLEGRNPGFTKAWKLFGFLLIPLIFEFLL